jgi:alpha-tubulin suppressor-like RCC1 family protein
VSAARTTPVAVSGLSNAIAIQASAFHTCALLANGSVRCWGSNEFGQLGIGTFGGRKVTPTAVNLPNPAVAIGVGAAQSCAVLVNGAARCWGRNNAGALGDGTNVDRASSVRVKGLDMVVAIDPPCALLANSNAHCWGNNGNGQLGNGTTTNSLSPVRVGTSIKPFLNAVAISASGAHTCALMADGSANCWGLNTAGQLGSGTAPSIITPGLVVGGGGTIAARDVAAGRSHTCAVRANGTVACWGSNAAGQLGDGTTTNRLSPVPVVGLTDPIVAIAAGEAYTCALAATGTARCWGDNSLGQLGDGTFTNRLTPVTVPRIVNAIGIAAGGALGSAHTCAALADGTVRCWGSNGSGQLGFGNTTPSNLAVAANLTGAVDVAVGEFHTCALLAIGVPFCWGFNGSGQVGNSSLGIHVSPTIVSLDNVVTLAGGSNHTCGLRADGTQWCWGGNLLGQLGNNSTVSQSSPQLVVTPEPYSAVAIAGGFGHSCAVASDGSARCWGDNGSGQLGNSTVPSSLTPVAVGRLVGNLATFFSRSTGMVNVTTGRRHSCALQVSGGVSCWGDNSFGQVGINSTAASQVSPATVPSFLLNIDPNVVLRQNPLVTGVTILANCKKGRDLQVDVTLTQGDVRGSGVGTGKCSGGLKRFLVRVPAQGPYGYVDGAAQVSAVARIRKDGSIVDKQKWTRAVQISSAL